MHIEDLREGRGGEVSRNRKGRDFGYALATCSCEGADSVDACTVTASDVTTAFAVRTPAEFSQNRRFFRVRGLRGSPRSVGHPAYFGSASFYSCQTFRPSTETCDIGYGLAACSCEGTDNVDARTVTTLDATTAFAVPNPGGFLAKPSVFSGPATLQVAPLGRSPSIFAMTSAY